jgi:hypothetical protein
MSCMALFAPPMAMATTQLARAVHYEDASVWQLGSKVERNCLRMSWVVVTDSDGSRKLQMQWRPSADLR